MEIAFLTIKIYKIVTKLTIICNIHKLQQYTIQTQFLKLVCANPVGDFEPIFKNMNCDCQTENLLSQFVIVLE